MHVIYDKVQYNRVRQFSTGCWQLHEQLSTSTGSQFFTGLIAHQSLFIAAARLPPLSDNRKENILPPTSSKHWTALSKKNHVKGLDSFSVEAVKDIRAEATGCEQKRTMVRCSRRPLKLFDRGSYRSRPSNAVQKGGKRNKFSSALKALEAGLKVIRPQNTTSEGIRMYQTLATAVGFDEGGNWKTMAKRRGYFRYNPRATSL